MDRSATRKYSLFWKFRFLSTYVKVTHFLQLNIMIKFLHCVVIIITILIFQLVGLGFGGFLCKGRFG